MRSLSLNFRRNLNAPTCEEVGVMLVTITHPSLPEPLRLSSDPTTRVTDDPPTYATISNGETFTFVMMNMLIPDDKEGEPLSAQLQLENVEADAGPLLEPILGEVKVTIQVVLASSPDFVEIEYADLDLTSAQGGEGAITLSAGREDTSLFTLPGDRMTRDRFPGLF
jgi:hypothetical protein